MLGELPFIYFVSYLLKGVQEKSELNTLGYSAVINNASLLQG